MSDDDNVVFPKPDFYTVPRKISNHSVGKNNGWYRQLSITPAANPQAIAEGADVEGARPKPAVADKKARIGLPVLF